MTCFADMKLSTKANNLFNRTDRTQLAIYKAVPRGFSINKAKSVVKFLENKKVSLPEENLVDGIYSYRNTANSQYLSLDSKNSTITFIDNKAEGLNDEDIKNQDKLLQIADGYVEQLMGDEAKDYKFINNEFEYFSDWERKIDNRLFSVSFRYVKKLDGRLVLGNTNYILITLGKNGTPGFVKIVNPQFEKVNNVRRAIAMKSMPKYLQRYLNRDIYVQGSNGKKGSISSTTVKDATESFFLIHVGKAEYLFPHLSFITKDQLENGEIATNQIHIPLDVDFAGNVDKEDVRALEALDK